ncbi:hypothetical protein V495_08848 [Pseudogymnoascus sp. VKM F-4514 (FW-929)]|nr:hypothetical protein V490_04351 [Pseudogymnoascus sp. VKM F-3557]KFY32661.1 hypothetical protein V495_08848 [Pseudogymnoascus sp. VKM F-4514 (FW-929)]KFY60775.1 hypothetical protein V497_03373 [Pseudogymnoascus sp. VKM F-4516 (FW-969)]
MTPLGRIIITNARFSSLRLNYLLFQLGSVEPAFIVEPERQLSVPLHVSQPGDSLGDFKEVFGKDHLDLKCGNEGKTALHLAVHVGNVGVVRELLDAGADKSKNDGGMTPAQLALELSVKQLDMGDIVRLLTDLNV